MNSKMPTYFIGHGVPTNALEDNEFSRGWRQIGKEIPTPEAILSISAHWLTQGTHVTAMPQPRTIHDFGGFPRALYDVQYPAPGHPELATTVQQLIRKTQVGLDQEWGLDHGTWSVVRHLYPEANIPVLQLSIDYHQPASYHYELAKELAPLREQNVLIIGSGNMVHNLRKIAFDKFNELGYGYDWALEMNEIFKSHILESNHEALIHYETLGQSANLAIPTPDHYYPLLYVLALQEKEETPTFFNDYAVAGALTMTSVKIS